MLVVNSGMHSIDTAEDIVLQVFAPAYDVDDIRTYSIIEDNEGRVHSINENVFDDNKIHVHR